MLVGNDLRRLEQTLAYQVYVDTNVFQHATPLRPTTEQRSTNWGGEEIVVEVSSTKPVGQLQDLPEWLRDEIELLPRVADLARRGTLELFEGVESLLEATPQYSAGISAFLGNPFAGLERRTVPDPIYAGRVIAGDLRDGDAFLETIDPTFEALKEALGGNKDRDAFHIYSAEQAGLDFYLTLDKKLYNIAIRQRAVDLSVEVVLPSGLLERVEVA